MTNNLAAAVEMVDKWCRESSEWKADKRKQLIPSHFDLGRIKALDQCAAELKTILAELGRGAGEPVAEVVKPPNGFGVKFMDGFENLPSGTKLYTRPPVAGLAELTDEQWSNLFDAMGEALMTTATSDSMIDCAANKTLATAARAYLAALPEKGDGYEIDLRRFRPAVKLAHTKARQQLLALENGGYPEHYRPVLEADEAEQFALLEYIDALPQPKCRNCNGHGEIGYTTGQTPESFEQGSYPCPDCNPQPKGDRYGH